ncbi:DgyrCDS4152 [Dimorphilus gyrociliatus]|uniref:DgyrCDS4152 n=1 Tax=Dimorphilus gyrociliatus TaxID=2664684 RepID=A0A7I8VFL0_9ANNE|nr:DgyrCDS4152 [Dimorphilus gyrociliatus]
MKYDSFNDCIENCLSKSKCSGATFWDDKCYFYKKVNLNENSGLKRTGYAYSFYIRTRKIKCENPEHEKIKGKYCAQYFFLNQGCTFSNFESAYEQYSYHWKNNPIEDIEAHVESIKQSTFCKKRISSGRINVAPLAKIHLSGNITSSLLHPYHMIDDVLINNEACLNDTINIITHYLFIRVQSVTIHGANGYSLPQVEIALIDETETLMELAKENDISYGKPQMNLQNGLPNSAATGTWTSPYFGNDGNFNSYITVIPEQYLTVHLVYVYVIRSFSLLFYNVEYSILISTEVYGSGNKHFCIDGAVLEQSSVYQIKEFFCKNYMEGEYFDLISSKQFRIYELEIYGSRKESSEIIKWDLLDYFTLSSQTDNDIIYNNPIKAFDGKYQNELKDDNFKSCSRVPFSTISRYKWYAVRMKNIYLIEGCILNFGSTEGVPDEFDVSTTNETLDTLTWPSVSRTICKYIKPEMPYQIFWHITCSTLAYANYLVVTDRGSLQTNLTLCELTPFGAESNPTTGKLLNTYEKYSPSHFGPVLNQTIFQFHNANEEILKYFSITFNVDHYRVAKVELHGMRYAFRRTKFRNVESKVFVLTTSFSKCSNECLRIENCNTFAYNSVKRECTLSSELYSYKKPNENNPIMLSYFPL